MGEFAETIMHDLAILFDVDNTLLDNDGVKRGLSSRLEDLLGGADAERFWSLYEDVRKETGLVDIPATIQRYVEVTGSMGPAQDLTSLFFDYPFKEHVFHFVPAVLAHARSLGTPAIVSDGDQVFQTHKIRSAGLEEMVEGRVLITVHKESEIPRIRERLPAKHYVMVDDKARILGSLKRSMGAELTTVFVCQGKYAHAGDHHSYGDPDQELDTVAEFTTLTRADLLLDDV
jgi:FMN phosphatase YigB (HAD superfamily)